MYYIPPHVPYIDRVMYYIPPHVPYIDRVMYYIPPHVPYIDRVMYNIPPHVPYIDRVMYYFSIFYLIAGTIPPELGSLSELEVLDTNGNKLTGMTISLKDVVVYM